MKALLREFGYLRLVALLLAFLPLLVPPLMGIGALWTSGWLWYWLGGLLACGLAGYGLHALSRWRNRSRLDQSITHADPNWAPGASSAWTLVETRAQSVSPEDHPLNDVTGLFQLGRETLNDVAGHFHPERSRPALELTLPHMLLIIERASRELRHDIADHIPMSHRLTLGSMARLREWKNIAARFENVYRLGRAAVDPTSVVFRELRRDLGNRILGYGSEQVQTWLLREFVRKVGYYAIELYSGRLLLDDATPVEQLTAASRQQTVEEQEQEPLRILVLGRSGCGRSSLVNALLGEARAATDSVAGVTQQVQGYHWEPDAGTGALILDTPGVETPEMDSGVLKDEVLRADLILWVTSAVRAGRREEKETLASIGAWFDADPTRRPPPIIGVLTHVDRLRPVREWHPPYDLTDTGSAKAVAISAAVNAISAELMLSPERLVPVSLREDSVYNVEDALVVVICEALDEARRVRFLRCLEDRRKSENWQYLWRQLRNAGRFAVAKHQELD